MAARRVAQKISELEAEKRDGAARERALCAALAEMEAALGDSERARRKALKKLKKLEGGGRRDSNGGGSAANGSVANLFRAGSVANLFGTPAPAPAPRRSSEGKSEGRRSKGSDSKM